MKLLILLLLVGCAPKDWEPRIYPNVNEYGSIVQSDLQVCRIRASNARNKEPIGKFAGMTAESRYKRTYIDCLEGLGYSVVQP